ncbi:unnamed protein product [Symbiodinium microadriaticum]|nr:unnamed protein product [Symbiodinium microadriaticum]
MVAAKRGYAIVVQALLDAGADFCATSESNERAIDLTKDYSTRTILQQLDDAKIAKERAAHILTTGAEFLALIGRRDVTAVSKLLAANIEHYPEIMEFEFDTMVSAGGVMRFNRPLGVAVMTHCAEMVDMLVKAGADVNAVHSESTDRFTPLMQNCMQPYLPSFPRTMSSRQAECDRQGITATLLDNGASINLVDNVRTCIYPQTKIATRTAFHIRIVSQLLNPISQVGQTAVMKCVLAGHAVDLKLILDRYSPENNTVNAVDKVLN